MKVKRFKVRHEPGGCRVTCVITPVLRLITSSQTRSLSYQFPVSRVTFRSLRPVPAVPYSPWPWDPLNVNVNGASHGGLLNLHSWWSSRFLPFQLFAAFLTALKGKNIWDAQTNGGRQTETGSVPRDAPSSGCLDSDVQWLFSIILIWQMWITCNCTDVTASQSYAVYRLICSVLCWEKKAVVFGFILTEDQI